MTASINPDDFLLTPAARVWTLTEGLHEIIHARATLHFANRDTAIPSR